MSNQKVTKIPQAWKNPEPLIIQRILGFHEAEKEGFEESSHPANPHKINFFEGLITEVIKK